MSDCITGPEGFFTVLGIVWAAELLGRVFRLIFWRNR